MNQLKLVLAEKPSVAQAISAVLGATLRRSGYLEGNGYLVSWCVGHLVEMAAPEVYDSKYAKWRREDLPIIPEQWKYAVSQSTQQQFRVLQTLMKDSRVTEIVCATDAGREGELIFRLVYEMCDCRKPIERLWISSLEKAGIQKGFRELQPGSAYDHLYQAALCRARADWLVGMNVTRLLSTVYNQTLSVGRVMTPTLALVTDREAAVTAFRPAPFYTVLLDCGELFAASERYAVKAEADRIAGLCNGKNVLVQRVERHEKRENPPCLYDLTTLQREANRLYGFTAQQTLDYTQALYEKKLATYPRTDSRYLPEGMLRNAIGVLDAVTAVAPFSDRLPVVHDITQILNDAKVTDHHAIIPTEGIRNLAPEGLPAGERAILTLLMARLVCAVGAPHAYAETTARLLCENFSFTAKGKQTIQTGWRDVHTLFLSDEKEGTFEGKKGSALPGLREGEMFPTAIVSVRQGATTPPPRFTEDSLLAAMERAGAEEAAEDTEYLGLGTPATRAATIEKLVRAGFIERRGEKKAKHLVPTSKGVALIAVAPESVQSPLLTAEWEHKLTQVEHGALSADDFMSGIAAMLRELVGSYKRSPEAGALFPSEHKSVGQCPYCQENVVEKAQGFFCESGACGFGIWKNNFFFTAQKKEVTADFVAALLRDGRVFMRNLHSPKTGKPYDAYLLLDPEHKKNARFKIALVKRTGETKVSHSSESRSSSSSGSK